jgi:DNA polymerase
MTPVTLDFETEFSDEFTLKKLTTEAYIRDARFKALGAAIKWSPSTPAVWYDEKELRWQLAQHDWSDTFLICHHSNFDGLILSHHYGVVPKMYGCTLSMARLLLGNHVSASLDSVRKHFGMALKSTPYAYFKGRKWEQITRDVQELIGEGACDEVESIWKIFGEFAKTFPTEEYEVVDTTIRFFTTPCLKGDPAVFGKVWAEEATKKQNVLERLGVTEGQLQSADSFADLLREFGVEPAMKDGNPAKVTGEIKQIYAFAKTDPFMEELLVDEDEDVRALAEARLGVKSTLLQTRAETMGWMASRGPLCVYLSYCAAHTSRWGGGDGSNFQNWTNGSEINSAIIALDGYLIAEPDASQIECRLLNFCAGQWDKVEEFRGGGDPYIGVASAFYGYPVNKKDHPDERQLGKIVELQAGYGSGGEKIRHTIRIKSKGKIILDEAGGLRARDAYRNTHPFVTAYWKQAEQVLYKLVAFESFDWGPFRIRCDVATGKRRIVLPNGIELIYDTLERHRDEEDTYFRQRTRRGWVKTYGSKLVENVIQALARVVISQAMIRLKRLGYRITMTKHDSLWVLIPKDAELDNHKAIILTEMSRELPWLPGCPLSAEFKTVGERYA